MPLLPAPRVAKLICHSRFTGGHTEAGGSFPARLSPTMRVGFEAETSHINRHLDPLNSGGSFPDRKNLPKAWPGAGFAAKIFELFTFSICFPFAIQ